MEEFKKPCLPAATVNVENSVISLRKPNESLEINIEKADLKIPQTAAQQCPYKAPPWSDMPGNDKKYSFEVLKSGQIIDEVKELQKKAYWTFGRLPENDIAMAHPTISRFHAILQYRSKLIKIGNLITEKTKSDDSTFKNQNPPEGWYIYDLDSTHGTFLNKQRLPPKIYIRIKVGHMLRLGASSRSYILQGPSEDEEPESDLSITELKAKRQKELEEAAVEKKRLAEEAIEREKNEGCGWGMGEDADEETDLTHNPYASTNNEEIFLNDPKKTLRGYFEREGLELVYKCDEMSAGSFVCRVELPIDDANGRAITAEVVHKGKKKDCVLQCALEACRLLDRHGVLRQAHQEPLKRKKKTRESDSDEDEFWDRTGDVARKKQRKSTANASLTLTYDDLLRQENDIDEQIKEIESRIREYQEQQRRVKVQQPDESEDLDAFMENIQENETKLDKTEIRKLRLEENRLKSEKQKVQRLIIIAKPIDLPFGIQTANILKSNIHGQSTVKKQLPIIGKRNQFSKFKIVKVDSTSATKESKPIKFLDSDEEEMEEDEKMTDNKSKSCKCTASTSKETTDEQMENVEKLKESITVQEKETCKRNSLNASHSDQPVKTIADDSCKEIDTGFKNMRDLSENKIIDSGSSSKKRRHRIRQRGKRQEVKIDDAEYESSDKYAKWVPPENQTGDGFTELNKKFGY